MRLLALALLVVLFAEPSIALAITAAQRRCRWVLPPRVVRCESGGRKHAVNWRNPDRPAGLYQIITLTWRGHGGGRFAGTADRASCHEQGVVARRVLRSQGRRAWACW